MTLETDFITLINADLDLTALLPGKVYSAIEVDEISRQLTPDAFNANKELLACALVKQGIELPRGPYRQSGAMSVQTNVTIFLYEYRTSENIDQAMDYLIDLFSEKRIADGMWNIEYENGSWNQTDDTLNANLCVLRFNAVRMKTALAGGS